MRISGGKSSHLFAWVDFCNRKRFKSDGERVRIVGLLACRAKRAFLTEKVRNEEVKAIVQVKCRQIDDGNS